MITHVPLTIRTNEDARTMYHAFQTMLPLIGVMDTETTGLHIIHDKPFLFQFGWLSRSEQLAYTFAADIERQPMLAHQVIKARREMSKQLIKLFGHNIKYDSHMLTNIGEPFLLENLSDTMFFIRFAHPALTVAKGGPPLGLKDYASRFVTRDAKRRA